MEWPLGKDIKAKVVNQQTFKDVYQKLAPTIFGPKLFMPFEANELEGDMPVSTLLNSDPSLSTLFIIIYHNDEAIGFSWGLDTTNKVFYMVKSGLLPAYRGRGLYSLLLQKLIKHVKHEGFDKVHSRHLHRNNRILIPKLKAGFYIDKFETSAKYGLLVHLSYDLKHP